MSTPTDDRLMAMAQRALHERLARNGRHSLPHRPEPPPRPDRRKRSLQTCHRYALNEPHRAPPPKDSGAYVPALAARLEDDRNLTDGARRCARKLAEYAYRKNREGRAAEITVTYLMKALGRCRRAVQRYLRALEREGYIRTAVLHDGRTRMCAGLLIELLAPLFPRHHARRWPAKAGIPDATLESQNQRSKIKIPIEAWAMRCMDGVFRSLMKTLPPLPSASHLAL